MPPPDPRKARDKFSTFTSLLSHLWGSLGYLRDSMCRHIARYLVQSLTLCPTETNLKPLFRSSNDDRNTLFSGREMALMKWLEACIMMALWIVLCVWGTNSENSDVTASSPQQTRRPRPVKAAAWGASLASSDWLLPCPFRTEYRSTLVTWTDKHKKKQSNCRLQQLHEFWWRRKISLRSLSYLS